MSMTDNKIPPASGLSFSDISAKISSAIINSLHFPVIFIDSSHTILRANNAAISYLSEFSNNIIGKKCPRLRKDKFCALCPLEDAIKSGKIERRDIYDDRRNKWYSALVSPLPINADNMRPTFILSLFDITEKMEAGINLHQEKMRSTLLANNFLDLIHKMLEIRYPAISKHLKMVALLATAIAAEMGLDDNTIEGIRIAALLHDIGKIEIPPDILARMGHVSLIEESYIQKHPQYGRDLIAPLSFPWPVSEIIYQHHERMDGSGYPEGITGDKIRLEAKIISVAEVVESMTSHQSYRPAFSIGEALIELKDHRGILYDPEVVEACVLLFKEKAFTFKEKTEDGAAGVPAGPRK